MFCKILAISEDVKAVGITPATVVYSSVPSLFLHPVGCPGWEWDVTGPSLGFVQAALLCGSDRVG